MRLFLLENSSVMADFGQTDFGQPFGEVWYLFHGFRVGFHVWVLVSRFGLDRPSSGPPKISLFPSPAAKFVLFFPLWVSSR